MYIKFNKIDVVLCDFYFLAETDEKGSGRAATGIVPGDNDHVNFGFYGTRQDAFKMLQSECKQYFIYPTLFFFIVD